MRLKKQMITVGIMITLCLVLLPNDTRAALQANGKDPAYKSLEGWMTEIRQMQAAGGALGLTDTINFNANNYDSTKAETCNLIGSNTNLDIHMEKNTEYGAMAILSASSYGNQNQIGDGETTTGNKTGVVMKLNSEWTAASRESMDSSYFYNSAKRYKNTYPNVSISQGDYMLYWSEDGAKVGDALFGDEANMANWYDGGTSRWFRWCTFQANDSYARGGLVRAIDGNIFTYDGDSWDFFRVPKIYTAIGRANISQGHPTRAVVVVGSGI